MQLSALKSNLPKKKWLSESPKSEKLHKLLKINILIPDALSKFFVKIQEGIVQKIQKQPFSFFSTLDLFLMFICFS